MYIKVSQISSGERKNIKSASLKLSRENGGLNLIDIQNKITTQRIKWLFDLIKLFSENFIKVVANKVMGKFNAGHEGLDIFKVDITEMNPKSTDHFYRHAIINALQKIKIKYNLGKNNHLRFLELQISSSKQVLTINKKSSIRYKVF